MFSRFSIVLCALVALLSLTASSGGVCAAHHGGHAAALSATPTATPSPGVHESSDSPQVRLAVSAQIAAEAAGEIDAYPQRAALLALEALQVTGRASRARQKSKKSCASPWPD